MPVMPPLPSSPMITLRWSALKLSSRAQAPKADLGRGRRRAGSGGWPRPSHPRPPFHRQPPERGVDRVGVAQARRDRAHHVDARVAQRREIARRQAAVHVVDGVGDHQDVHLRHRALARQQRVPQLDRQLAVRLRVEIAPRWPLNRKKSSTRYSRASPMSANTASKICWRTTGAPNTSAPVTSFRNCSLVERRLDDRAAHAHPIGKRLEEIPEGGQQPEAEETIGEQPSEAPLSSRRRWRGRRIDR